jgi:hypothetical protein
MKRISWSRKAKPKELTQAEWCGLIDGLYAQEFRDNELLYRWSYLERFWQGRKFRERTAKSFLHNSK